MSPATLYVSTSQCDHLPIFFWQNKQYNNDQCDDISNVLWLENMIIEAFKLSFQSRYCRQELCQQCKYANSWSKQPSIGYSNTSRFLPDIPPPTLLISPYSRTEWENHDVWRSKKHTICLLKLVGLAGNSSYCKWIWRNLEIPKTCSSTREPHITDSAHYQLFIVSDWPSYVHTGQCAKAMFNIGAHMQNIQWQNIQWAIQEPPALNKTTNKENLEKKTDKPARSTKN